MRLRASISNNHEMATWVLVAIRLRADLASSEWQYDLRIRVLFVQGSVHYNARPRVITLSISITRWIGYRTR